ncbi:MAG: DUF3179 domain-containing protein [SAR324 cluster bacterium]|nr:DUF3179 domain-containing protein [SAR324 cluster bacterium]
MMDRFNGPAPPNAARNLAGALLAALLAGLLSAGSAGAFGFEGGGRDVFPVFDNPPMLTAARAEANGVVFPRDAVIGVSRNGEARAYPISIMGFHELGNDTIAGVPIAVSW